MAITYLPGTTIQTELASGAAERILTPMFYSGGLVLSQVSQITGLEGYIVQNWVKRKFLAPPQHKKYSRRQLCRLLFINVLKDCFTLDQAALLLGYINGVLSDDSDDLIDDSVLYGYFVDCIAALGAASPMRLDGTQDVIARVTADYSNPNPSAGKRLSQVLDVMLAAYEARHVMELAAERFAQLDLK
ncbi:MAG: DUF1836 domain-containing protein [Oscillospiraceae bacterium]|nr:DUF1836 domain-containing protein [Oscillospiraceae bacterium]